MSWHHNIVPGKVLARSGLRRLWRRTNSFCTKPQMYPRVYPECSARVATAEMVSQRGQKRARTAFRSGDGLQEDISKRKKNGGEVRKKTAFEDDDDDDDEDED